MNSVEELNTDIDNNKNWNRVSVTRRSLPNSSNINGQKYSTGNRSSKSHIYANLPANTTKIDSNDKNHINGQKYSTANRVSKSHIYENLPSKMTKTVSNDREKQPINIPKSDTKLMNRESLVILKHLNTIKSLQSEEPTKLQTKAPKRVEFCKTEVHFTPESGKIEIIETEKKPVRKLNLRKGRKGTKKSHSNLEKNTISSLKRNETSSKGNGFIYD